MQIPVLIPPPTCLGCGRAGERLRRYRCIRRRPIWVQETNCFYWSGLYNRAEVIWAARGQARMWPLLNQLRSIRKWTQEGPEPNPSGFRREQGTFSDASVQVRPNACWGVRLSQMAAQMRRCPVIQLRLFHTCCSRAGSFLLHFVLASICGSGAGDGPSCEFGSRWWVYLCSVYSFVTSSNQEHCSRVIRAPRQFWKCGMMQ